MDFSSYDVFISLISVRRRKEWQYKDSFFSLSPSLSLFLFLCPPAAKIVSRGNASQNEQGRDRVSHRSVLLAALSLKRLILLLILAGRHKTDVRPVNGGVQTLSITLSSGSSD